ncbi:MAG: hypothetical protein WAK55_17495 [Xanthobacteraceae bacterium]
MAELSEQAQRLRDVYFKALKIAGRRNVFEVMAELLREGGRSE